MLLWAPTLTSSGDAVARRLLEGRAPPFFCPRARKRGEQNRSEEPVDTDHQGAEVATLSIPERCSSRVEGRRSTGERKSAKILPFPELLRA